MRLCAFFGMFIKRNIKSARKVTLMLEQILTAVHLADQEQVGSLRVCFEEFAHISPFRIIDYRLRRWHCKQKDRTYVSDMCIFQISFSQTIIARKL